MLTINGLSKLYKNGRGVSDVSLSMERGEVLGLLGPNGSGKTTIMKACVGLLKPTRGTITIEGFDMQTQHEAATEHIGALIEAPALFENMSARRNLMLAAAYYADAGQERVDEVLKLVGLEKYARDRVGTFSLGMRQRLGLALALINHPRLLILDEPANGLDIEGMVAIRDIIRDAAANGTTVMVSSHLAHEIELCASRAAILHEGRLLSITTLTDVLAVSPSLEDFYLSEVNRFRRGETA